MNEKTCKMSKIVKLGLQIQTERDLYKIVIYLYMAIPLH